MGRGMRRPQLDAEARDTLLETWLQGPREAPGRGGWVAPPRAVRPQPVALPASLWPQPRRGLKART